MIAKMKGKATFRPALADILREGRYGANAKPGETVRVLVQSVPGSDAATLAANLTAIARTNARVRVKGVHMALSPTAGEWLREDRWRELAADFLAAMDFAGHAYVLVLHEWEAGQHAHIVVSRVGPLRVRHPRRPEGSTVVNDWRNYYRAQRVLDTLEAEYGLVATRTSGQGMDGGRRRERGA